MQRRSASLLHKHRGSGLAALDAQIEGAAAGLREIGARLEAIKATASAIHNDATHKLQALTETLEHRSGRDDLDRIVTLKEAADMRRVSVDTLRRKERDKFVRRSDARYGMRLRDVLLLDAK
jgi:hypothetical protein